MSRKTRKLKNRLLVPFEWIVRRHPSCWILNYNYFSTMPTPNDLATLAERQSAGHAGNLS